MQMDDERKSLEPSAGRLEHPSLIDASQIATVQSILEDKPSQPRAPPLQTLQAAALPTQDVLRLLGVDEGCGLFAREAPLRRVAFGSNELGDGNSRSSLRIVLAQFANPVTVILAAVFVIGVLHKEWIEAVVVVLVILLNSGTGAVQELKAEKSMNAIRQLAATGQCTVVRDGGSCAVDVDDLVIGDIVSLRQGHLVPADLRFISVCNLEIDESAITGESQPAIKTVELINTTSLGDCHNLGFRQTAVVQGYGTGVVISVGAHTEVGKIAAKLSVRTSSKTPLIVSMDRLMYSLFAAGLVFGVCILSAFKWKFEAASLMYASATLVAILPEAAVVLITLVMALGTRRMAGQHAIVRKMAAVEQLGKVTDICSDKTGTLTQGVMTPARVVLFCAPKDKKGPNAELVTLTLVGPPRQRAGRWFRGASSDDKDEIHDLTQFLLEDTNREDAWRNVLLASALCSNVSLQISNADHMALVGGGNPTEVALAELVHKGAWATPALTSPISKRSRSRSTSMNASATRAAHEAKRTFTLEQRGIPHQRAYDDLLRDFWEPRGEWPFDSACKRMTSGYRHRDTGASICLTKGAPDVILPLCRSLRDSELQEVSVAASEMARAGLRVIALAYRSDIDLRHDQVHDFNRNMVESNLCLCGLVGVRDPPKHESQEAVRQCHRAGITVRMLTGDHPETAVCIAREIGIPVTANDMMTGPELDKATAEQLDAMPQLPLVVARCSPKSKVVMIEALHRRGRVVAMTGDGVNDAMAIKQADVGISMGITGSEVTKGVADIVLADDNFATIVAAVREGRRMFHSITKFILHLLSGNMSEAVALLISLGFVRDLEGLPVFVLSPLAILWINTSTGCPSLAIAFDPPSPDQMETPPLPHWLFTPELVCDSFIYGSLLGGLSLIAFSVEIWLFGNGPSDLGQDCNHSAMARCGAVYRARGTTFLVLNVLLSLHAYVCRHPRLSTFAFSIRSNKVLFWTVLTSMVISAPLIHVPWLSDRVFKHTATGWAWVVLAISIVAFVVSTELYKLLKRSLFGSHDKPAVVASSPPTIQLSIAAAMEV